MVLPYDPIAFFTNLIDDDLWYAWDGLVKDLKVLIQQE